MRDIFACRGAEVCPWFLWFVSTWLLEKTRAFPKGVKWRVWVREDCGAGKSAILKVMLPKTTEKSDLLMLPISKVILPKMSDQKSDLLMFPFRRWFCIKWAVVGNFLGALKFETQWFWESGTGGHQTFAFGSQAAKGLICAPCTTRGRRRPRATGSTLPLHKGCPFCHPKIGLSKGIYSLTYIFALCAVSYVFCWFFLFRLFWWGFISSTLQ